MPHNAFPDPQIEHGSFRVLPITTGGYIIIDVRRPPGKRRVGDYVWKTAKDAGVAAEQWHKAGHG